MAEPFRFTREVCEKILDLRLKGIRYSGIAEFFQYPGNPKTLKVVASKYRNNKMNFVSEEWKLRRERTVRQYLSESKITEIAHKEGVSTLSIKKRLSRAGMDREVRAEILGKKKVPIV